MASGSFSGYVCGTAERPGYKLVTSWTSEKNIAGNYSTVTCTHKLECGSGGWGLDIGTRSNKCKVGDDEKTFSSSGIHTGGGTTHDLGTTVHKIPHDAQGRKTVTATSTFSMQASISNVWRESITATGTMVLDDIPRASSMTAPNGTLGTAIKFSVSQADTSFYHVITYSCGNVKDSVAVSKTQNKAPTWTPPLSLASQSPGLSKVTVLFTITTYSGDTPIGTSTATAEYIIPANSVKPGISLSVSDVTNYKTTYGNYVQGKSKFKVTVTGTPAYSSPIKTYSTTINGGTPYTEKSFETDVIKDAGTYNIVSTITDERSNSNTATKPVTVLEYHEPRLSIIASRGTSEWVEDIEGKYLLVTASYDVSTLGNKNKFQVSYKYRKVGDTKWKETKLTGNYQSWYAYDLTFRTLEEIEPGVSYELEVSVTDNFTTVTQSTVVGSSFVFFHFNGPTKDGGGKNKLNLIEEPYQIMAEDGALSWGLDSSDIFTISNNVDGLGEWDSLFYKIYDLVTGDVVRFNTTILDSHGRVRLYVIYNETTSDGYFKKDEYVLNYIDGKTISEFEVTIPNKFLEFHIEFPVGDGSGGNISARWSTRYKRPIVTINEKDMKYERFNVGIEPSLGVGKMAELPNGVDFGLKAKFNKGFVMPTLPAKTNLNSVTEPNFYIGLNASSAGYTNCPITSRTFHLEVTSAGDTGELRQKLTACDKSSDTSYVRYYYGGSWGSWIKTTNTSDVIKTIYPVGSIYMSINSTDPKTLFPGTTWERLKDRFLLGAGDTYTAGSTGGSATVTLTEGEMPSHSHASYEVNESTGHGSWTPTGGNNGDYQVKLSSVVTVRQGYQGTLWMGDAGGDHPHENMPPYLTVYMWKRTA